MAQKKHNRTTRVLKLSEIESLNLPLRQRDVREDGFIFKHWILWGEGTLLQLSQETIVTYRE